MTGDGAGEVEVGGEAARARGREGEKEAGDPRSLGCAVSCGRRWSKVMRRRACSRARAEQACGRGALAAHSRGGSVRTVRKVALVAVRAAHTGADGRAQCPAHPVLSQVGSTHVPLLPQVLHLTLTSRVQPLRYSRHRACTRGSNSPFHQSRGQVLVGPRLPTTPSRTGVLGSARARAHAWTGRGGRGECARRRRELPSCCSG